MSAGMIHDRRLWRIPRKHRGHEPTGERGIPPNEDLSGLFKEKFRLLRGQGGGGSGFVVENGLYVPLQYTNMDNPLQGGFGYCDKTDRGQTFHPGADLNSGGLCNADEGVEVVSPADGVVVARLSWDGSRAGEGNHLWVYLDDPRCVTSAWMHLDHLAGFAVSEGQRVGAGQRLGWCGRTGNWACAHLHLEFARKRPNSWWQWPYGWPLGAVQAAYFSPRWWWQESVARAGQALGPGAGGTEDDVRTTTTQEEREAVKPYFEMLGIPCNMDTGIMQRAALAYYRDESRGPALSGEYPTTAPDGSPVTHQKFTAGIGEAKQQSDGLWWTGWAEVVAHPE